MRRYLTTSTKEQPALLPIGTRIYNNGDMANPDHFGTITDINTDRWGTQYEITPDADSERKPYWIPPVMFSAEYKGNGSTRFVTEAAYETWRKAQIEELQQRYPQK